MLKRYTDNGEADFITRTQLCKMFGVKKPDSVNKYVKGLKRISNKYYAVDEVAARMVAEMR